MIQVYITVFWSFSRLKILERTDFSGIFGVTIFIVVVSRGLLVSLCNCGFRE